MYSWEELQNFNFLYFLINIKEFKVLNWKTLFFLFFLIFFS